MTHTQIRALIRAIPDFPEPGIIFRDITTLIGDGPGFTASVNALAHAAQENRAEAIAGVEARGFIFGAAVAAKLGLPFVPVRKPGKLPVAVLSMGYTLEYGSDTLEIDPNAISDGQRVVLIDDLIATGGTAQAAARLIRNAGGTVELGLFVIDLPDLGGTARLAEMGLKARALVEFSGH